MAPGYAVYHEMDYGFPGEERHLERGQFVELEVGTFKNDNALLTIGYIKEHDGENLNTCLRCGTPFVNEMFLRFHEQTCPMTEVRVPEKTLAEQIADSDNGSGIKPPSEDALAEIVRQSATTEE